MFLFQLFASRKTTVHLYQAPEMRQLKRFSKNGIYAVSEYLDMLLKGRPKELCRCYELLDPPGKTHLLLYFYVKSEGLRAI